MKPLFDKHIGTTRVLILKDKQGNLSMKLSHDDGRVHVEPVDELRRMKI